MHTAPAPVLGLPAPPSSAAARPFKLTRFHAVTSLVGIALVTLCLLWSYRDITDRHLLEHEGRANADQARAFANTVWADHRDFVVQPPGRSAAELLADPRYPRLRDQVLGKMRGLQVAKVTIYSLDGLTVFSTDLRQVGEDGSANPGFREARSGLVVSQRLHPQRVDGLEGTPAGRDMIASYVPVRGAPRATVEGVIELDSDVTALVERQREAQWQAAAMVVPLLALLYLFLCVAVRKADRIMARQESDRAAREAVVRHQAWHDALTGLPNRACFAERLARAVAAAARDGHAGALMFIDLDRFKLVNDSLGHAAGDLLLQAVAGRLRGCLREGDLLFRMGGDEFTVVLPRVAAPEEAAAVAQRMARALAAPVAVHAHELVAGATIGIALYPADGDDVQTLLRNADAAMYSAKASGRGTHAFYRAAMNQRALQRLELESALQRALRAGEFTLHYQPRLDAGSRRIVAVEALLRWASPTRGLVLPGEFIGVLEETGMMKTVGEWVLRSACGQLRRWRDAGLPALRVSVNVSPVQFQAPSFVATVERVLRETGAPAAALELELTESLLIEDLAQGRDTLAALKALGLAVSIDDFGTGHSSLNYLRHFAVDYVKIDRSFVSDVTRSARDRAVATAIVELARALDIGVVAEGVETPAQASFFHEVRCGELQGFLFGRPVPPAEIERLLAPGAALPGAAEATPSAGGERARAG